MTCQVCFAGTMLNKFCFTVLSKSHNCPQMKNFSQFYTNIRTMDMYQLEDHFTLLVAELNFIFKYNNLGIEVNRSIFIKILFYFIIGRH